MVTSGELGVDAVWSGAVRVEGDVVVPRGRILRVEAGAELSFAERPRWSCAVFRSAPEGYPIEASAREACDIVVLGELLVEGREESPVTLGGSGARWGGITVLESGRAALSRARLSGARDALLQGFDDARLELDGCELSGAPTGAIAWGLSSLRMERCRLDGLDEGVIAREGAVAELLDVSVRGGARGAVGQNWSLMRLEGCSFCGCSEFGAAAYDRSSLLVRGGRCSGCGQGLLAASRATLRASGARLSGNRVGAQGIEAGQLRLDGCAFEGRPSEEVRALHEARVSTSRCRFEGAAA